MRFLIISQYFPPETGALCTRLLAVTQELGRLGHDVEVVTTLPSHPFGRIFPEYRGRFYVREEWGGAIVHRLWAFASQGGGVKRLASFGSFVLTSAVGLLRARKPDFIIADAPPLFVGIPAVLAGRAWGCPVVFHAADLWPDAARDLGLLQNRHALRAALALERWVYRNSTFVSAVAEGARETLLTRKQLPRGKVIFLPNGIDTDLFRPLPYDADLASELGVRDRAVFLYAGTHGYAHALDQILDAAEMLRGGSAYFLFVGGGSDKARIQRRAAEMRLDNVRFLDPVPAAEISRLYSISVAAIATVRDAPVFRRTRSAKIFSAMSCAKAVLSADAGETSRLVREAEAGYSLPPEDAGALAAAVRAVLADPEEAARLGRNGRQFMIERLSWSSLVPSWIEQMRGPREERQTKKRGGGAADEPTARGIA